MFPGPDSMGFVWGGVGRALMHFMTLFGHFCYVGSFGDLGDPVVPPLRGVSGDVLTLIIYLLGYRSTFFARPSLA